MKRSPGIVVPAALLLAWCMNFLAADVPESQIGEVQYLIDYLRTSDCGMIRNGKLHDGAAAARHVQRKYDYFRDDISSTEGFIELAATKSTRSGRLYQVQCPGGAPVSSADWLLEELANYRAR